MTLHRLSTPQTAGPAILTMGQMMRKTHLNEEAIGGWLRADGGRETVAAKGGRSSWKRWIYNSTSAQMPSDDEGTTGPDFGVGCAR